MHVSEIELINEPFCLFIFFSSLLSLTHTHTRIVSTDRFHSLFRKMVLSRRGYAVCREIHQFDVCVVRVSGIGMRVTAIQ